MATATLGPMAVLVLGTLGVALASLRLLVAAKPPSAREGHQCMLQVRQETTARGFRALEEGEFDEAASSSPGLSNVQYGSVEYTQRARWLAGEVAAGKRGREGLWRDYQQDLALALRSTRAPSEEAPLRVLLATYAGNEERLVDLWSQNVQRLQESLAGDIINFAFFHYDGNTSLWERQSWYRGPSVRLRHVGRGCPPMFWRMLNSSVTKDYDYVWLIDGDLHLGVFSWDVYRDVLVRLRPLVSQPSIVPRPGRRKSSNLVEMRLATGLGLDAERFAVAREASRSEVMTPIIATELWEAVHARLEGNTLRNSWFTDAFWDLVPLASKAACGSAGIVVVDASPARHMDFRSLRSTAESGKGLCTFRAGTAFPNNRPVGGKELEQLGSVLRGRCGEAIALLNATCAGRNASEAHRILAEGAREAQFRSWSREELLEGRTGRALAGPGPGP